MTAGHIRAAPDGGGVEFRILGLLEVVVAGRLIELRAPKVRSLLGMLLLHPNEVVSADRLADALWGYDHPLSAANTVQGYVSQIRKALGADRIQTHAPGYLLAVDKDLIDAVRFEGMLEEGRQAKAAGFPGRSADVLARALRLWRGDPLADFIYDEWAQPEIARLGELRVVAIEECLEARLDLGHHNELLGELESLVTDHPLRERLWAARILALYRSGRQAEALRAYQELRARLGAELGIEPSPNLAALEESVLRQDASLEWRAPPTSVSSLPVHRSTFVGRDKELCELETLLQETGTVTLVGTGGVGKTRLAIEVARRLVSAYDDVRLVELAALSDPSHLPHAVATACGVSAEPGQPLFDALLTFLRSRRVLIVLDNCEHLLEATAGLVHSLLRGAPKLSLLATSREPLRFDGERVWRAPSLPAPPAEDLPLEDVLDFDAVRLFLARAKDADARFTLTENNAPAVAQICRRLDGIPLALELAAARVPSLTPSQIAARLDDRFRLLETGLRSALPRHRTLSGAIQWSYDLCSRPEQLLFESLSVFSGEFSLDAAEAVCGLSDEGALAVVDLLSTLVSRSVVVAEHPDDEVRYRLLESLRQFAQGRLDDSTNKTLGANHLQWTLQFLEALPPALGPHHVHFCHAVGREIDNVRQGLYWALHSGDAEAALRVAVKAAPFWEARNLFDEGRGWLLRALELGPSLDRELRTSGLIAAGALAYHLGDYKTIASLTDEVMANVDTIDDETLRAECLTGWGAAAGMQGEFATARVLLLRAREAWDRSGGLYGGMLAKHVALGNLAMLAVHDGDLIQAQELLQDALDVARRIGNDAGLGDVLIWLAQVEEATNQYERATVHLEESIERYARCGNALGNLRALMALGLLAERQSDSVRAAMLYHDALVGAGAVESRPIVVSAAGSLGRLAVQMGQQEVGARLLDRTETMAAILSGSPGSYRESLQLVIDLAGELLLASAARTATR